MVTKTSTVVMADIVTGKGAGPDAARRHPGQHPDALPDDDDHILVSHNKRDKRLFDVYRINIKTGAETLVAINPGNINGVEHRSRGQGARSGRDRRSTRRCSTARPRPSRSPLLTTNFP